MAGNTKIGGTNYEISGGKTRVNGTVYSIAGGKTMVGGALYDISFGTPAGSLAIGSSVYLNISGVPKEFIVVHQGNPSSRDYDASCDGTWILMKDIYTDQKWHKYDTAIYKSSDINTYLNTDFLNKFDSDIIDSIKYVKIPHVDPINGIWMNGSRGLPCKVFLLSAYEAGFTTVDSNNIMYDGEKLDYFESGSGSSASNKRIANLNGSPHPWWLRSPNVNLQDTSGVITENGYLRFYYCSVTSGVRPALILPSDFKI